MTTRTAAFTTRRVEARSILSTYVLVALQPARECASHELRGMHQVAGHQGVHLAQRRLDRPAPHDRVRSTIRERVLELDLAGEHASDQRLTTCCVGRVFGAAIENGAHKSS